MDLQATTWDEVSGSIAGLPPNSKVGLLGGHPSQEQLRAASASAERELAVVYELAPRLGSPGFTTTNRWLLVGDGETINLQVAWQGLVERGKYILAGHMHGPYSAQPSADDLTAFGSQRVAQASQGFPVQTRSWVLGLESADEVSQWRGYGVLLVPTHRAIITPQTTPGGLVADAATFSIPPIRDYAGPRVLLRVERRGSVLHLTCPRFSEPLDRDFERGKCDCGRQRVLVPPEGRRKPQPHAQSGGTIVSRADTSGHAGL